MESVVQGLLGAVSLLIDKLATDVELLGQVGDGLTGQGLDCQLLALLGAELVRGAGPRCCRGGVRAGGQRYNAHACDLRKVEGGLHCSRSTEARLFEYLWSAERCDFVTRS